MILTLSIQFLSNFAMVVVLLLVQVLIYPQFSQVGPTELSVYVATHGAKISWIVIPLMFLELGSLAFLWRYKAVWSIWLVVASSLLMMIWGLTFLFIVPVHNQLIHHSPEDLVPRLISLNFWRTLLWGVKFLVVMGLFGVLTAPLFKSVSLSKTSVRQPFMKPNGAQLTVDSTASIAEVTQVIQARFPFTQILLQTEDRVSLIVRTPMLKFPDHILVSRGKEALQFRSQSLLGYSDFGANKRRLDIISVALKGLTTRASQIL